MLPLRIHSDFSLLKAMGSVPKIVTALKEKGFTGAALTDFDCGFGWVDFYMKMKAEGLKPMLGSCLEIALTSKMKKKGKVCFLVTNKKAYQNLSRILSAYSFKSLDAQKLLSWSEGLILLVSPDHPELSEEDTWLKSWPKENLYYEVQRFENAPPEEPAIEAAKRMGAKNVATHPVFFLEPEHHLAHEVMMSIGTATKLEDADRPQLPSHDFFLRSRQEYVSIFFDHPEWIEETENILNRAEFEFETDDFHLPSFGNDADVFERFKASCFAGLEERLDLVKLKTSDEDFSELRKTYEERLDYECGVVHRMRFAGYFLIVADFIQWSKNHDIPVGPGRGSGAGSLAAYCLKITDIDPIEYKLLFERFLNPERVSMPDFDIDFCIKGRDQVIQYVREKYNLKIDAPPEQRLKVSQIVTYGKMKSKAVIRDVGRALGIPYSDVDAIAKLIPNVLNITLQEAFELEPEFENLRARDPKASELLRIAEQLEGLNRHTSVHAAGVVIADDVLTNYLPLYQGSDEEIVIQYEMKAVEKIGLVKFDFLGLRNLTVIQECIRLTGKDIDLLKIDYNDPKVMAEISTGETVGIFQLESSGMRDVIRRLQPTVFEDLIAIVALYRPGPLEGGMVDDFILRKRGQRQVTYPVEALKSLLEETYGVFVYQEQVMGTANVMAGYSLGEADMLRRAMGKKIASEMAQQRERFVSGSKEKGYGEAIAQEVFDLMSEFAKYGFNKSHAAAYAMITFQTAYLKTYYPDAFFAALLSSEKDDTEKLGMIIRTSNNRGQPILAPHVNFSKVDFGLETKDDKKSVRYGLAAIKNLGANVAKAIVEEREQNGDFKDFQDFFSRISPQLLNKRQAECLIRSGALDGLGGHRSSMFASLETLSAEAQAKDKARKAGQGSLFATKPKIKILEEWPDRIRLNDEKHLLGTYMTGHPLASYAPLLASFRVDPIGKYLEGPIPSKEKEVQFAGLVVSKKEIMTKKGTKMAFFTLEDLDHQIEIVVFSDLYAKKSEIIVGDRFLLVRGQLVRESGSTRMLARELSDVALANFSELIVSLKSKEQVDRLGSLVEEAQKYQGGIALKVRVPTEGVVEGKILKSSHVTIETEMSIQSSPKLLSWIETEFGKGSIQLN